MRMWIGLCATIVLVTPGCMAPRDTGSVNGAQAESQLKPATADEKLAVAVKDKLASDPELKKETIGVEVKDGRVTLTGTVSNDGVRARADELARDVPDVFGVDTEKLVAN